MSVRCAAFIGGAFAPAADGRKFFPAVSPRDGSQALGRHPEVDKIAFTWISLA